MKDYAAFPGNTVFCVDGLVVEETLDIFDKPFLHIRVQDDVGPGTAGHGGKEVVGFLPGSVVEDEDFVMQLRSPFSGGEDEGVCFGAVGRWCEGGSRERG